ncbi:hypothetical protein EVAR_62023_1 [Eumeta japonica]|uniref:Uncharacterized protein n=1 Tax=Eumeta variegata TaxID=151549 RepID=A0A4C1ZG26_EUMVA|nr:hypothetical protein EVAR_62023_1 [Eumeta japonica]
METSKFNRTAHYASTERDTIRPVETAAPDDKKLSSRPPVTRTRLCSGGIMKRSILNERPNDRSIKLKASFGGCKF